MGYSTTDGTLGEGLGQFNTTASTLSDLNKLLALIKERGNRRKGTTAARAALTGAALFEGLEWFDTDVDALYVYIGGAWASFVPRLPHAEYTISVTGLGDGSLFSAFAFTADSSRTSDASFSSIVSNKLRLQPGVYAVSVMGTLSSISTGRCALLITAPSFEELARSTAYATENVLSTAIPNYYAATSKDLTFSLIKTTGGSGNFAGRVRVTKISGV